jgi:hypothetical protein
LIFKNILSPEGTRSAGRTSGEKIRPAPFFIPEGTPCDSDRLVVEDADGCYIREPIRPPRSAKREWPDRLNRKFVQKSDVVLFQNAVVTDLKPLLLRFAETAFHGLLAHSDLLQNAAHQIHKLIMLRNPGLCLSVLERYAHG